VIPFPDGRAAPASFDDRLMVKRAGGALLLAVRIDPASPRPLSAQLYVELRDLILSGGFGPHDRLPATRTLAAQLRLSRTTVIEAYDRLTAEGLIESRIGAGTFVSRALEAERPRPPHPKVVPIAQDAPRLSRAIVRSMDRFAERRRLPSVARAFTTALPAFDAFPMAQWARLAAKHWRANRNDVMGYGEPFGLPALRHAIAGHLRANRGIGCEPGQIFSVGGAQAAFSLIGSLLLNPGDKVWFENPGAIGARNSFIAAGADLVPVALDRDGLCVDDALARCPRFRLAFVTPSHQQPLGMVMSLERRFALLSAAAENGAWIVEDDYDGEFAFAGPPLPTLKSVDRTGLVLYVGTFSKSLFPSLRLGFLMAPPALQPALEALMSKLLSGVPTAVQATVAEFIAEGHFAAHLRRMRRTYAERHDALVDAAARRLAGMLDVMPSQSGLHTIARLHRDLEEIDVARAAEARGVVVSPIGRFAIAPVAESGLVLGFGSVKPAEIDAGVRVLAEVLDAQRAAGRVSPAAPVRRASGMV
jgi:GntR family transcriptional regulator/MocR family aminotransferase